MRLNWDLAREILFKIEDLPTLNDRLFPRDLPSYSEEEISYHLWLLMQAGMIVGKCNRPEPTNGLMCYGLCLTWQGHELLNAIRADTLWNKIKRNLAEQSVSLSLEAIKNTVRILFEG